VTAGDPLAGLPRPLGEPGTATGAARNYTAAATQLETSSQQVVKALNAVVGGDWQGIGATSANRCTVALAAVFSQAAQAAHSGGAALTTFGSALSQAQSLWDRARSMADQAMSDESSYRSSAETQAGTLDKQAATGNIGAAHAAAAVREDAASYASPLRSRATAMATQARQEAQTAATVAAGRLGSATAAMTVVPPAPSPTAGGEGGGEHQSVFEWFNDMVLGSFNSAASLLTLPNTLYGAGKWAVAARSAATLGRDLDTSWSEEVEPVVQAALRGEVPFSDAARKVDIFHRAAVLTKGGVDDGLSAGKASFLRGGFPDNAFFAVGGKVLGAVAVIGDVGTIISPGGDNVVEDTANRTAAAGNAISTLIVINAVGDDVPVAGELIMVGTGLYLGGDWLYHHSKLVHDAVDNAGHAIVTGVDDTGHALSTGYNATTHAVDTALHDANPLNWHL
jgi:hypothetical protein